MRKKANLSESESSESQIKDEIRPLPLIMVLICSVIIIGAGIYLQITKSGARGMIGGGRYTGNPGHLISLDGTSVIIIGVLMSILPIYELVHQRKRR